MKHIITLAISALIFSYGSLSAQEKEPPIFITHHKNIYGELFGSNILFGVNYDMRLNKGVMDGIGFRAGVGGMRLSGYINSTDISVSVVTFPLEFNHLIGKRRSSFVSGVGLLPVYVTASMEGFMTQNQLVQGEGFGLAGGFITLGYRFQPLRNGVMFQFNWNPMILRGSGFTSGWFGLGLGIGFK